MAKNVFLAVPAYTGTVHTGTMRAILNDCLAFMARSDVVTIEDDAGNGEIAKSRAYLVAKFLASEASDLVFIDADVHWQPYTLLKLVDAPVDCVGAIYPYRRDPIAYPVRWLDKPELWADPATGLLEVSSVPAGCLRLSRAMLEKMVAAYPETEFTCQRAPNGKAWHLFGEYRLKDNPLNLLSEDYAFCERWRDIGGQVWIDPEISMSHVGTKTFAGSIGEWLRSRPAS